MSSIKMTEVNVASFKNNNINQIGTDMIHAVIPMECEKYPSTTILKHENILAEVNKSHNVYFSNKNVQEVYSTKIYVRTMTI